MPLNLPFIAGQTKDPKQYEIWRSMAQQALKSQDFAATLPVVLTRGEPGTPLTYGLNLPNDATMFLNGDGEWVTTGSGGLGTVTSITAGAGITLTPNPIIAAGTVALAGIDWDTTFLPDNLTLPLLWAGIVAAALDIGVVDAQQHLPPLADSEQPIHQRGANIADMDVASGAWGETCTYSHICQYNKPPRS